MDKIIGMGNALVDVLVTLQDDSLLDEMSLPKGSMQLINEDKFLKISGKFSDMKTHKATGGSVGNTVLALANLGAHPGFIGKIGNDDFGQYFKKNGLKQGIDMKLLAGDLPTGGLPPNFTTFFIIISPCVLFGYLSKSRFSARHFNVRKLLRTRLEQNPVCVKNFLG